MIGEEKASKLDKALNKVERQIVQTSDCALKDMVGEYEFKDEEKGVFRYLTSVMRRLALGNFALAAASIAVTLSKVCPDLKTSPEPLWALLSTTMLVSCPWTPSAVSIASTSTLHAFQATCACMSSHMCDI